MNTILFTCGRRRRLRQRARRRRRATGRARARARIDRPPVGRRIACMHAYAAAAWLARARPHPAAAACCPRFWGPTALYTSITARRTLRPDHHLSRGGIPPPKTKPASGVIEFLQDDVGGRSLTSQVCVMVHNP
jgi:hypothetical protein